MRRFPLMWPWLEHEDYEVWAARHPAAAADLAFRNTLALAAMLEETPAQKRNDFERKRLAELQAELADVRITCSTRGAPL